MKASPLISVLIPAYNRADTIGQCLESVLANGYKNLEIIVSDNGSDDHTADVVQKYADTDSRIQLIRNSVNRGPLPNWKICLERASGKFVHWMWSDDWVESSFFAVMLGGMMSRDAEVGISAARIVNVEDGWWHFSGSFPDMPRNSCDFLERYLSGIGVLVSPASALISLESCRRHFYESIPNVSAIECCRRAIGPDALMVAGALADARRVYLNPNPLVNFRAHSNSISISSDRGQLEAHYAWARVWWSRKMKLPRRYNFLDFLRLARMRAIGAVFRGFFG